MRGTRVLAPLTAVLAIATSQLSAAILNNAVRPGINHINDSAAERLIDNVGNNGLLDVGDQLETVVIFESISNSQNAGTPLGKAVGDPSYQLTGYAVATVATKTALGGGVFDFTFTSDSFVTWYEDSADIGGTILPDFSSQSAVAAIAAATDGNSILEVRPNGRGSTTQGGAEDAGLDFWRAVAGDDSSQFLPGNEANFVFGLSVNANPGGVRISANATRSFLGGSPPGSGDFHDLVGVREVEVASEAVTAQGWDSQTDSTYSFMFVPQQVSACDFNEDAICDTGDLSSQDGLFLFDLTAQTPVVGADARFDLTGDGFVSVADRDEWLVLAAAENGFSAYLPGDTDLNGVVTFSDFVALAEGFPGGREWIDGNFDGSSDGTGFDDFVELAENFQPSIPGAVTVPEPTSIKLLLTIVFSLSLSVKRRRGF